MVFKKISHWIEKIEDGLMVSLLLAIIGIGITQIILRNFFHSGISWADVSIRHLFFILGFMGAIVATKQGGHLAMDLAPRLLSGKPKRFIEILIQIVSCIVTAILAKATYDYVWIEKSLESFLLDGIPSYWAFAIIPIGFTLISLNFLFQAIHLIKNPLPPKESK